MPAMDASRVRSAWWIGPSFDSPGSTSRQRSASAMKPGTRSRSIGLPRAAHGWEDPQGTRQARSDRQGRAQPYRDVQAAIAEPMHAQRHEGGAGGLAQETGGGED